MAKEIKRMNYYNGLFLKEEDFITEQEYHIRMRRLMNWHLNKMYGVIDGLVVEPILNSKKFQVTPGIAMSYKDEGLGVEIVSTSKKEIDLSDKSSGDFYITIEYSEVKEDKEEQKGTKEIHIAERAVFKVESEFPENPKERIILAKINVPSGEWTSNKNYIETSQRKEIGPAIRSIQDKVGLGTEAPSEKLEVVGNVKASGFVGDGSKLTGIETGKWNDGAGGAIYYNKGDVGIGTASPQGKLDVKGAIFAGNSDIYFTETKHNHTGKGNKTGYAAIENAASHGALMILGRASPAGRIVKLYDSLEVSGAVKAKEFIGDGSKLSGIATGGGTQWSDGAGGAIYYNKGNVGIGSASPVRKLEIRRAGNNTEFSLNENLFLDGQGGTVRVTNNAYINNGAWALKNAANKAFTLEIRDSGMLELYGTRTIGKTDWLKMATFDAPNRKVFLEGNVGIGTTAPTQKLEIAGNLRIPVNDTYIDFGSDTRQMINLWGGPNGPYGIGIQAGTQYYRSAANFAWYIGGRHSDKELDPAGGMPAMVIKRGNVGIGTPIPQGKLDVKGSIFAGNSDIYFTETNHRHTGIGNKTGYAAIENAENYGALMILGRASPAGRIVKLWDRLEVNGHVKITGLIEQDNWITPALQNKWIRYSTQYNPPGYFKDKNGIVHLRGMMKLGAMAKSIFTLPAGYQPEFRELQPVQTNSNTIGRCDILTNGQVIPVSGNNGWFSLDSITFRARPKVAVKPIKPRVKPPVTRPVVKPIRASVVRPVRK